MRGIIRAIYFLTLLIFMISCGSFEESKSEADRKSAEIQAMVKTMETYAVETVENLLPFFKDPSLYSEGLYPQAVYEFHDNVMYHNPQDQGFGKFLYSGYFPVGEEEKQKVKSLEHAIPLLKSLKNESDYSDYIAQTYVITFDTLIIFYPWSDLLSFIPPKRNIMDRGGWKALNHDSNPSRDLKWTPPYVDTTGKGFVVDVMIPVDNGDFMEAFVGIDITISTIKDKFLSETEEKMLMVDKTTSQIIAISDKAVELLGVENAEAFRYLDMIDNSEIARQVMPDNLVLTKTDSEHMRMLWSNLGLHEDFSLDIAGKEHQVYSVLISGPEWFLVTIE